MERKIIPIEVVRERQYSQQTWEDANKRGVVVRDRMNKVMDKVEVLWLRARTDPSVAVKLRFLRKSTEYLAEAMKGQAACSDKCSHCCNMPILISQAEADQIAKETSTKINKEIEYVHHAKMEYNGTPCPFLKDNRCSIYNSRPIACRVHYILDKDNMLCQIRQGIDDITAPHWNNMDYIQALVQAMGREQLYLNADIRDFFGKKK
jgi:Fe-S-cluster containining protein